MEKLFDQIPEHLKPKNVGTDALFKGSFLEKFTRTHISVPVTMHLLIVAFFIYMSWFDVFEGIPGVQFTVLSYIGIFALTHHIFCSNSIEICGSFAYFSVYKC